MKIEELRDLVSRLHRTLAAEQVGPMSWHTAIDDLMTELVYRWCDCTRDDLAAALAHVRKTRELSRATLSAGRLARKDTAHE